MPPQSNDKDIGHRTIHTTEQRSQQIQPRLDQSALHLPKLTAYPVSDYIMLKSAPLIIDDPFFSDTNPYEQCQMPWQLTVPELADLPYTGQAVIACYYKDCYVHSPRANIFSTNQGSLPNIHPRVESYPQSQSHRESRNLLDALAELRITSSNLETYLLSNERFEQVFLGPPTPPTREPSLPACLLQTLATI
jgi:hypothetical protein